MIPSSDTPVLVQAALLPIELSKPTTSQHPPPEATPERPRPSALPGPPQAFPSAPSTLPGPSQAFSGTPSALPGPPPAFPGPPSALPGPPPAFPGTPSALPGTPSAYPGQPSALPGPSPAFAGPPSAFSAPPSTFSGPPSTFPGPGPASAYSNSQSAPQGSYLPPQSFPPSAKLASVDHTTVPPPSTVQEPITSTPYGGGQPPARAANPQMAYSTPQTPPYSNPPQPYPPYSQPNQQQPDDCQSPPQSGYMQARSQPYSQPAQPMNQPTPQSLNQPPTMNQPIPQSLNQTIPQSQNQTIPQSQNQPTPQPRPRPQVPPQPNSPPQPAPQSPIQSRTPNPPVSNPPRSPMPSGRISEAGGRNSSIPQPYSSPRVTTYPPARPVLPMPKPPPHLLHILQQQEEQRKQQQYFLLQQQLQSMQNNLQHQVIEEGQQRYQPEAPRQRASVADSRPCDLERDSDDTESQSTDAGRPSLKQRPNRLNKRIVTVPPHSSTPPAQAGPQPATSPPSTTGGTSNPNQRICKVPPHPYGTIIPRFSTQHAFNVSHNSVSHANRIPLAYSAQAPPRPDYLQSPLPGPSVTRPPNSTLGATYYQNPPSTQKPPETTTRNTICQTDPEEYPSKPQGCPAKQDPEVRDAPSLSPVSEPLNPSSQASQPSESPQPPNQTQGIQARLSHAQPLNSPAQQTTHVMGSIQMMQSPPVKYTDCAQGKEDFYVPAYSVQPATRTSFSERNSGQSLLQQQQSFQMPPWQQLRQTPSPQYIQLGTFPPSMAAFARSPAGGFVQSITERPLKLSLPSQVQTTQLYPQNFSNVGVGIRSANSCPGDVRIGAYHPGLMHGHRPGSPHHTRARSAGRVSVSESTASVWASNSNPHHLP